MERNYWSKERIVELVEKYHITKRSQLLKFKKDGLCGVSAYSAAKKLGILDELFGAKRKIISASYWTEERIRKFINDNNINSRSQLLKFKIDGISGAIIHKAAKQMGILDDLFGKKKHHLIWTKERICLFVENNNITSRKQLYEYKENDICYGRQAYDAAKRLDILDELFGKRIIWTEDTIRAFVIEHHITTRTQLSRINRLGLSNKGAYAAAKRLGILDDLFGKLNIIRNYTKERIHECALQCKTRSEFAEKFPKEYAAALRHDWLEDVTKHMPIWVHKDINKRIKYVVYAYEELTTHSVYVGLTNNCSRRDREHRTGKNKDKLYEFCI